MVDGIPGWVCRSATAIVGLLVVPGGFGHGSYLGAVYRLQGKLGEQQRDLGRREHVIHFHVFDGAPGIP